MNVALIGQGFMGRAHSNAYCQVKHFFDIPLELRRKVLCARDRGALDRMAAIWGWEEVSTDWRGVVERKDIDLVDVASPNSLHAEMAIAAAQAGKIVLCEKPLALNAPQAEQMAAAARQVRNMVWFNYRRVPAVAFARQLIDEGRIGRVFHYRATYLQEWGNDPARPPSWKTQKEYSGSGVLGDLLSHLVDLALYLNGPIHEVSALTQTFAENRNVDDATLALARFANGSIATFEATRYAVGCRNSNTFQIHGSRGMLRFNLEDLNRLEFCDATEQQNLQGPRIFLATGPNHPYAANFWKPGHIVGYEHTFIAALGDFLNAVLSETAFHPDFDDAVRVHRVLDAVDRSARERRWVAVD